MIFLDLMMPKMDGWETLDALRADASVAEIPVILLTARTSEEDQIRGWGEGIFDYLPKPFNPQVLVEWATQAVCRQSMLKRLPLAAIAPSSSCAWCRSCVASNSAGQCPCDGVRGP